MDNFVVTLHNYTFMVMTTLFIFQSIILFIRSRNNTARKTMAILELIWGLTYALTLYLMINVFSPEEYNLLREKVLITGNFFITFTNFFPMQVLMPGWLNWKRGLLLLSPIILITAIYYGVMHVLGESPESIPTYHVLWNSIGHFNIWFRFVILLSNFIYIILILKWLYKYEKKYVKWKNENFADQEYVDISWMRSYDYIIIGIFLFYLGVLFFGGRIPVICHGIFCTLSLSYLFYKILFYESPYPEDFFASEHQSYTAGITTTIYEPSNIFDNENSNEQSFDNKIITYTNTVKEWLEKEKPFLYHDFKLTDVSHVLPLNRSYLSRVFNEGFKQNFSEVVRHYRIEYSKQVLKKDPSLPISKVAEISGFRSDTTYVKAFKQVTQMTPSQYRVQEGK